MSLNIAICIANFVSNATVSKIQILDKRKLSISLLENPS